MKIFAITKRFVSIVIFSSGILLFSFSSVQAAKVNCSFMMGEVFNQKDGAWEGTKDPESVMELFGYEGLDLEVSMSLLGKLDSKQPFLAGKTKHGNVYISGGEMGIEGKQVSIKGGKITIYSGSCEVAFG